MRRSVQHHGPHLQPPAAESDDDAGGRQRPLHARQALRDVGRHVRHVQGGGRRRRRDAPRRQQRPGRAEPRVPLARQGQHGEVVPARRPAYAGHAPVRGLALLRQDRRPRVRAADRQLQGQRLPRRCDGPAVRRPDPRQSGQRPAHDGRAPLRHVQDRVPEGAGLQGRLHQRRAEGRRLRQGNGAPVRGFGLPCGPVLRADDQHDLRHDGPADERQPRALLQRHRAVCRTRGADRRAQPRPVEQAVHEGRCAGGQGARQVAAQAERA